MGSQTRDTSPKPADTALNKTRATGDGPDARGDSYPADAALDSVEVQTNPLVTSGNLPTFQNPICDI